MNRDMLRKTNLYDRSVLGRSRDNYGQGELSDYEMIVGKEGKELTINEARKRFGKRERIYFVDPGVDGPIMDGGVYLYSNYDIKVADYNEKRGKGVLKEDLSNSKLQLMNRWLRDKILEMDQHFSPFYTMYLLPRGDIKYGKLKYNLVLLENENFRKRNMSDFIDAVGALINIIDKDIVQIWQAIQNINIVVEITDLDNGRKYKNTKDFMSSVNIKNVVDNQFRDLPNIDIEEVFPQLSSYANLIVWLGKAMLVAVCFHDGSEILNPLPEGFQDFRLLDRRGKYVL
jgi:hypothetical protein